MKSWWLLVVPLACAQQALSNDARISQSNTFNSISHEELSNQNTNKREFFVDSLTTDGILAIRNVPGLAEARRNAFTAVQSCIAKSPKGKYLDANNEPSLTLETLADGTQRQSIGTQIKPGNEHAEISSALLRVCPELEEPLETLRETVDKVSSQLMFALDDALLPASDTIGAPLFHDRAFSTSGGYEYMRTASTAAPFRKYAGTYWQGFAEATQGATQLEHFHSYTPQQSSSDAKTLNYHTDAGLFLLFVPAWYSHDPLDLTPTVGDFKYLDKSGAERALVVRGSASATPSAYDANVDVVSDDSLIMMVGKGAEEYLTPALKGLKMRAVPHALTVSPSANGELFSRNWYGRMFLPPTTAYLSEYKMTYGELRGKMIAQSRDPLARAAALKGEAVVYQPDLPAGCDIAATEAGLPSAAALRSSLHSVAYLTRTKAARQEAAEAFDAKQTLSAQDGQDKVYPTYGSLRSGIRVMDSCQAGEIWCWHTCEAIAAYNLNCSTADVVCVGPDGQPADPDEHNTANHPGCVGMTDAGGFCAGSGVNMYMEGFVSYATGKYRTDGGSATPECLVLWFSDWKLDSAGKFAAACFGAILFGIFTEFLSYARRLARTAMKARRAPEQILVMCFLYALQLGFGYFCMLIAMTYQVELFVCIVVGLGAGHALFNFKPSLPADPNAVPPPTAKAIYTDKDKGFRGGASAPEEDEVVDPCCQYLAMEEDSEHTGSTKALVSNGTSNPLRRAFFEYKNNSYGSKET